MGYGWKWRPSRSAAREFGEKMREIDEYCRQNMIEKSFSGDSYYFRLNGQKYRVSNHTIAASDRGMYRENGLTGELEQVRESYHKNDDDLICFTAGKTRIIEIHKALKAGKQLDKRGNVKE